MTGSHRALNTEGQISMKQQNGQKNRGGTADIENRKYMKTYSAHANQKNLALKSNTEVRSSVKTSSKRRANSNHTTEKKVNLDKFLSVVKQRSNCTPSNQLNGRMAPQGIAYLYKTNEEKKLTT